MANRRFYALIGTSVGLMGLILVVVLGDINLSSWKDLLQLSSFVLIICIGLYGLISPRS